MKSSIRFFCTIIASTVLITGGAFAKTTPTYEQKKLSGFEMGMGVPLVTPLTGYNMFVGYTNKQNSTTFLGKRLGVRADFTISTGLHANATVSDNPVTKKYEIDASGKILGYKLNMSDFTDKETTIDHQKDSDDITIGDLGKDFASASFSLKNSNMGLMVDFYPFADTWFLGGLRFSGGYYTGKLDMDLNVNINKDINFDYRISNQKEGGEFKYPDKLKVNVPKGTSIGANYNWKYSGPYAGFGFDLGIYRGFKFFLDAGVVFAHAPHISDDNIKDDNFVVNACYDIDGTGCNDMIEILHGVKTKPDVDELFQKTIGYVAQTVLTSRETEFNDVWTAIGANPDEIDYMALGADIVSFLNDGDVAWINTLITAHGDEGLTNAIELAKNEFYNPSNPNEKKLKEDIDKSWKEYQDNKDRAYKDVNKVLDDYGIIPMVKIGFMYSS